MNEDIYSADSSPTAISKGRSRAMDIVTQKMDELALALTHLDGFPCEGRENDMPQEIREITLIVETKQYGNSILGHSLLMRYWPEEQVPPLHKVVVSWQERESLTGN
jgi:hypothetical protein